MYTDLFFHTMSFKYLDIWLPYLLIEFEVPRVLTVKSVGLWDVIPAVERKFTAVSEECACCLPVACVAYLQPSR
jgi:hypothetical protein